jgi:2-methylcitrate dehydratase
MTGKQRDTTLARIAQFIAARRDQPLSAAAANATSLRLTDAVACALAARETPVFQALAPAMMSANGECPVIGGGRASLENAAFLNNVLVRQLDWNDTYIGKNGGHPSDFAGAALALAQHHQCSGADLLQALETGSHLMLDFCDAASALSRGWDPSTYVALGAVATLGLLAKLDNPQMSHALAMTAINAPMLLGRTGNVSTWKGLASAVAVRHALFAVQLAQQDMSGPDPVFEGASGFATIVSGPLDLQLDAMRDRSADSHLKFWPAIYHAQGPIELCLAQHENLSRAGLAAIDDIEIGIYEFALRFAADSADKWTPQNIETADHSIPFIAAHCLMFGEYGLGSLHRSLNDERVHALAQKVRVVADPEFSAQWPARTGSRLRLTISGQTCETSLEVIAGHASRPLDREQVRQKFLQGAAYGSPALAASGDERLLGRLETVLATDNIATLFDLDG